MARQLNGTNQYFDLTVNGVWRKSNYNWFIGGWMRFLNTTTNYYIVDFGVFNTGLTGGAARCRLMHDGAADRILGASSRADGTNYRDNAVPGFVPDPSTWYYVGYMAMPDTDCIPLLGTEKGVFSSGNTKTGADENVCLHLRFGARAHQTLNSPANIELADWIWCSDSIPTDPQFAELAAGTKPADVSGLVYTHHWAFDQAGDEPSLTSAATLTATNNPPVVDGPTFGASSSAPLPIIII